MEIEAKWKDQTFILQMEIDSSGSYQTQYMPGGEGSYAFIAKAYIGEKQMGSSKQNVEVIPHNREFIQTDLDSMFLKRLAENSGGIFVEAKNVSNIFNYLDLGSNNIRVENEMELRYKAWLLYLIIGIAVLEWAIRKKNNLV